MKSKVESFQTYTKDKKDRPRNRTKYLTSQGFEMRKIIYLADGIPDYQVRLYLRTLTVAWGKYYHAVTIDKRPKDGELHFHVWVKELPDEK